MEYCNLYSRLQQLDAHETKENRVYGIFIGYLFSVLISQQKKTFTCDKCLPDLVSYCRFHTE